MGDTGSSAITRRTCVVSTGLTDAVYMAGSRDKTGLGEFQALVAAYQDAIYRVAYRLSGNREDAEDLAQESIIEAFQAFHHFRVGTRFDQWVYRIMTRNYIDKFRRRKRVTIIQLDDTGQEYQMAELADCSSDPQEVLDKKVWSESVQIALDRLGPEFRAVVVLCDIQGLSYEEASQVIGCPVGTVRSRLHRARAQLRASLRPEFGVAEGSI